MVENDAYGELRYHGEPLPALKQLDERGGTVLLRSFSKISFPGLRVGWVVGPQAADRPAAAGQGSGRPAHRSALAGRAAAISPNRDGWRRIARACWKPAPSGWRRRWKPAARYLPAGTRWTRPQGGMNVWVRLPEPLDAGELAAARAEGRRGVPARAVFRGVAVGPGRVAVEFCGARRRRRSGKGLAILGRVFARRAVDSGDRESYEPAPAMV